MKLGLLLLVLVMSFKTPAAQVVDLNKDDFGTLYHKMMVDTFQQADNSGLAAMGGFPNPYILVYSVKAQKFVSDENKFLLLEFGQLNDGKLTGVPLLIINRPQGHHFFKHLSFEQLQRFLPQANKTSEYIVFYSSSTQKGAADTDSLFMRARNGVKPEHHVYLPKLFAHINHILENNKWQVFKTIRRD
ncbi:MAG: hypothetical protein HRU25_12875 [Psychrobium sp.]|nr:hypothetical protein [Psychrobium sp.]